MPSEREREATEAIMDAGETKGILRLAASRWRLAQASVFTARPDSMQSNRGGSFIPPRGIFGLDGQSAKRYVWATQFLTDASVADVGCGYGYGSNFLAEHGAKSVLGLDIDERAVEYAQSHFSSTKLMFSTLKKISDSLVKVDAVVLFEVIEHVPMPAHLLDTAASLLQEGGTLLISTPNKLYTERFQIRKRPTNPYHLQEFYPKDLVALISKRFKIAGCYVEYGKGGIDEAAIRVNRILAPASLIPRPLLKAVKNASQSRLRPVMNLVEGLMGRGTSSTNVLLSIDDYEIKEVGSPEEILKSHPVQIYYAKKLGVIR